MRLSLLFALAIFLRLALIPNPGFEADISFWKSWGLATYDKGIVEGMKVSNNNYPTPFAYVLGGMVFVYSRFADPHIFNNFWSNTNLLFLTISKLVPILADLGIAWFILWFFRQQKFKNGELFALIYLLNPLSLIDGALWGQVDSLGVFIFLLALLATLKKKPLIAGAIFMLAMMTKLQNMIYGPIFFLFIWQNLGISGLIQAIMGATTGFIGLNIEFLLARNADRVFANLTENYDYFPWMSLNAYNLWWVISGAKGMTMSDKVTILGLVNAKTVGLILFSGTYLFAVLRQFFQKNLQTLLESLILVNAGFFLFQTQSHDRYAFPLSVFLLLLIPFIKNKKLFFIFYILYSIFYFYNLHTALVVNYPHNGIPFLSQLIQPMFTIPTAFALLTLFTIFIFSIIKSSPSTLYSLLFTLVLICGSLSALNYPLITKKPISLTKITPYISEQGYGNRQTNMAVNSFTGGPNKWTRLSVQYIFYKTGFGTHANSKNVFDLNRKFTKFTTDFGIDTEAGSKASAFFEIYGDDKLLFRSEKMGRFTFPKHTEVSIKNVRRLSLVTTDAGDGITDDHTDWLNPILWP